MGVKSNAQKTRRRVLNGELKATPGGLQKQDLMVKNGRIVSKKASKAASRNKNLGHHLDNPPFPPFGSKLSRNIRSGRKWRKKSSGKRSSK